MKLSKFCDESLVTFSLKAATKDEVIEELVTLAATSNMIKNRDELLSDVRERENLVTTGVGYGVAFPHAKTRSAKGIVITFGRSAKGIDFEAMDHRPVNLFFLIAAPEDAVGAHLNVMARLSFLMKSEENRKKLMQASSPGDVLALIDAVE
ncbi:PTS fructose transporter subunit IIA [candidate division GN15 bacterium]|uniref:PTS fructose transporter subunit IIA n=1 Tax=candidate division GN15 bacterium TaxID=2072418 RepID=A0A855WSW6_9BACT|nr:MAG: PTS fructose transporter subunit IIA [candidate division GN15 bacterium]